MSSLFARLRALLALEPAAISWALNGGVALLCAYGLGLDKTGEAAVATGVTALAAIYTAIRARPVAVSTILGGLTTLVTAAAAFGFHPTANVIAIGTSIASIILSLIFRVNLTPKAALPAKQRVMPVVAGHP
jgi:hypothetical protein